MKRKKQGKVLIQGSIFHCVTAFVVVCYMLSCKSLHWQHASVECMYAHVSIYEQKHVCLQPHILEPLHTEPLKLSFLKKLSTATSEFISTSAMSQTLLLFFFPFFARSFSLYLSCPLLLKQAYPSFCFKKLMKLSHGLQLVLWT